MSVHEQGLKADRTLHTLLAISPNFYSIRSLIALWQGKFLPAPAVS